jgi:hypothetical protein
VSEAQFVQAQSLEYFVQFVVVYADAGNRLQIEEIYG